MGSQSIRQDMSGIEIWKPIIGFDYYMVSNMGDVKNIGGNRKYIDRTVTVKSKILSPFLNNDKLAVHLFIDKKRNDRNVDVLVAEAFVEKIHGKPSVRHKDGNLLNNRADNLEWSDVLQRTFNKKDRLNNAVDEYINQKISVKILSEKYGVSPQVIKKQIRDSGYKVRRQADVRKLTDNQIAFIIEKYNLGGVSTKEIADTLDLNKTTIMKHVHANASRITNPREKQCRVPIKMKQIIMDMYIIEKLNATEISKVINLSINYILSVVGDNKRSQSEVISSARTKEQYTGKHVKFIETKFGRIKTDSSFEIDRIRQLELCDEIKNVSRCYFMLPYFYDKPRRYVPDFYIEYQDGRIVIEEVKAEYMLSDSKNVQKFLAGEKYCKENKYEYRIVTEKIIYKDGKRGRKKNK